MLRSVFNIPRLIHICFALKDILLGRSIETIRWSGSEYVLVFLDSPFLGALELIIAEYLFDLWAVTKASYDH